MKRSFLLIPLLILTSCSNPIEAYSVHSIKVLNDEYSLESSNLSHSDVKRLLTSSYEYMLFFYSSSCSICQASYSNVSRYIQETKNVIYSYNLEDEVVINDLKDSFTNYKDFINYPALLFFKDNNVVFSLNEEKMTSYNNFKNAMKKHVIPTRGYYLDNIDQIRKNNDLNKECLLYVSNENSILLDNDSLLFEYAYPFIKKEQKPFAIIPKNKCSYDNEIIYIKDGEMVESINYTNELELAKDLIHSYYSD